MFTASSYQQEAVLHTLGVLLHLSVLDNLLPGDEGGQEVGISQSEDKLSPS